MELTKTDTALRQCGRTAGRMTDDADDEAVAAVLVLVPVVVTLLALVLVVTSE
jgi:uncharacterized protein (DUF983 family)